MILNILAIGDIVGEPAVDYLKRTLPTIQKEHNIHFTVANGENISGMGITPAQARSVFDTGVDIITLGNHTWNRIQICDFLDDRDDIIRPANFAGRVPGIGATVWTIKEGVRIAVINLMGRLDLNCNLDSPFKTMNRLLREVDFDICVVDFHAEATSEKGALAWFLDGKVSAVWGTHTHVPTADTQILPKGTGFVTDLGMVGPVNSILGLVPDQSINLFMGGLPRKFQTAEGKQKIGACVFSIDSVTKKCIAVKRVDTQE